MYMNQALRNVSMPDNEQLLRSKVDSAVTEESK
jgi:hypothetical protein